MIDFIEGKKSIIWLVLLKEEINQWLYLFRFTLSDSLIEPNFWTFNTALQAGCKYSSCPAGLSILEIIVLVSKHYVRTSTNQFFEETWDILIWPPYSFSLMKCLFISKCLVLSCWIGLWAMLIAALLSL